MLIQEMDSLNAVVFLKQTALYANPKSSLIHECSQCFTVFAMIVVACVFNLLSANGLISAC